MTSRGGKGRPVCTACDCVLSPTASTGLCGKCIFANSAIAGISAARLRDRLKKMTLTEAVALGRVNKICKFGALVSITHDCITKTTGEWAKQIGILPTSLVSRLKKMSIAEAIALPHGSNHRTNPKIEHNGLTLSVNGWAQRCGLTCTALGRRLRSGMPFEKAITQAKASQGIRIVKPVGKDKGRQEARYEIAGEHFSVRELAAASKCPPNVIRARVKNMSALDAIKKPVGKYATRRKRA